MIAVRRRGGFRDWLTDNYEHLALGEYPDDTEETPVTGTTLTDAFPGVDVLNQLTTRAAGLPMRYSSVSAERDPVTGDVTVHVGVVVNDADGVSLWAAALDGATVHADHVHTHVSQVVRGVRVLVSHVRADAPAAVAA